MLLRNVALTTTRKRETFSIHAMSVIEESADVVEVITAIAAERGATLGSIVGGRTTKARRMGRVRPAPTARWQRPPPREPMTTTPIEAPRLGNPPSGLSAYRV